MEWGILKGKLAKKIFVLFTLASFVPLLLASALAYYQVDRIIQADTLYNLQSSSKEYGLSLFFRLKLAKDTLINNQRKLTQEDKLSNNNIYQYFSAVAIQKSDSSFKILWGEMDPAIFTFKNLTSRSILTKEREKNKRDVYITLKNQVIAKINSQYLWDTQTQKSENRFCIVNSDNEKIFCPKAFDEGHITSIISIPDKKSERSTILSINGEKMLATYWSLFMDHEFGIDNWKIITTQKNKLIKDRLSQFNSGFLTLLFASLLLVMMLSSIVIRKNLKIIDKLIVGTKNIVKGNFKHTIDIPSNDELSELAISFNSMAKNMESIVNEYQAFSDIDQLILKSEKKEKIIESIFIKISTIAKLSSLLLISEKENNIGLKPLHQQNKNTKLNLSIDKIYNELKTLKIKKTTVIEKIITKETINKNSLCIIPIAMDTDGEDVSFITGYLREPSISELERKKLDVFANRISIIFNAMAREALLTHKANHDSLTGLPNKNKVLGLYNKKTGTALDKKIFSALLFLDLDHFKQVNDNHGHLVGDKLLQEFANRIQSVLTKNEILARLGGDEFIILLNSSDKKIIESRIKKICERVINNAKKAFYIDNHVLHIGTSIGVAVDHSNKESFENTIRYADISMYFSKQRGGNSYTVYNKEMSDKLLKRSLLERDLRLAIKNDDISVHFQPKFTSCDNKLSGFESLFRWHHDDYGNISPFIAIGIAEDIGLIADLGKLIFEKSITQWQIWLEQGYNIGTIAINVSPTQLLDSSFTNFVNSTIKKASLVEESMVELEVTESVMLQNKTASIEALQSLQDIGVSIAIDDFGTGYSSLSYLLDLPANTLKIDRAFVIKIEQDNNALALLSSVISLGKSMGYKIVAEGVETEQQAKFLRECKADLLQGYLFSKPLPAELIEKRFLKTRH